MSAHRVFSYLVDRFVRSGEDTAVRRLVVAAGRGVVRQPWFRPFLVRYVSRRLEPCGPPMNNAGGIRLLVLNRERYEADLEVLAAHPSVELVSLPSDAQHLLNAIFVSRIRAITEQDPSAYLRTDHPSVAAARADLRRFLQRFISALARRNGFDAMISCTFYYRQDREWEAAGHPAGVPFFVLHKENMKDPVIHAASIERYRRNHFKFTGDRLFLFNDLEKEVIVKSGVCPEEKISVVGGLRMDNIYRRVAADAVAKPQRQVVLFSFHHCVGLLRIPGLKGFFNGKRDAGFVEYFDLVHGTLARFAHANPDVSVVIKPKWAGHWIPHIETAIRRTTGLDAETIPNLTITADVPAQTLIEQSAVVVGINSTTLLEAKLFGRPVVVPLFAEAAGKYYDEHVYFQNYLDTFNVARSPEELVEAIDDELAGRAPQRTLPAEMVTDYLGFFDGRTSDRVVALMQSDIESARARRAW